MIDSSQAFIKPLDVGLAIETCATISSSKKDLFLAKVRSINWSTMTNFPGGKFSFKDPTADIETISDTPNCFKASIFALKFIFVGLILWPLP